jgi:TolB-like protein/DNA-binding winged helix-turn-helix (wHTH) protein
LSWQREARLGRRLRVPRSQPLRAARSKRHCHFFRPAFAAKLDEPGHDIFRLTAPIWLVVHISRQYNQAARESAVKDRRLAQSATIRFGDYQLDPEKGELRKKGQPVRLAPQPTKVLALLASRPGELVTREEIRELIWGGETFVDFEQGLNHCINQVRAALGDDSAAARFVETVPRRGYRFLAEVTRVHEEPPAPDGGGPASRWSGRAIVMGIGTLVIVAAILAAAFSGWFQSGGAIPPVRSIAVLPIENLSGDPEQEFFADGMTEELVTALGRIHALRVISRTSVMRYKRTKKPLPEIARELKVDAVIEGTVTQADGRVRLTANLLHAPSDRHLWAETFERDLSDVLGLQRELARTVARQIHLTLSVEDQARLERGRPVLPEAHEMYLKGQFHYYRWSRPEFVKAIEYYRRAIDLDPEYAQAHVGLAKTFGWQWILGALPPNEAFPQFETALKRARALDESLPEVHYVQAVAAWYFYWNWEQAEQEFRRALELNPNLEEARYEYAWFLATMGRHGEAVVQAERAVETDPLSVSANLALGSVYHGAGMLDRALAQLRRTIELEPNDPRCHGFIGGIYRSLGLYDEMVEAERKRMALQGAKPGEIEAMEEAYRTGGYPGLLRRRLAHAQHPFAQAEAQAQLGLRDEAIANLEKCYAQRWWALVRLNSGPIWDPLRADPRFQEILRRMNFPR